MSTPYAKNLLFPSMIIFVILLAFASGIPLIIISILQQINYVPSTENTVFWYLLFPLGGSSSFISNDETHRLPMVSKNEKTVTDNAIDISAPNYLSLAVPFFALSLLLRFLSFMLYYRLKGDLYIPHGSMTLLQVYLLEL